MSPDIDELLRTTMRRHASDAPTAIDLDAVRSRSREITRRRRVEAVAAAAATVVVLLGLGYAASQLRTETAPVQPVPSDGQSWTAFPTFDPNGQPHGVTSMVVRINGENRVVGQPGRGSAPLGWYGDGQRTLVYTAGGDTVRESTLLAVTVSADGQQVSAPVELNVPGTGTITGRAYAVDGSGPVVWRRTGTGVFQGELVKVGSDLTSATVVALPEGAPLFVTPTVVGLGVSENTKIQMVSTATGKTTGSFTICLPFTQVAVSLDYSHVAIACGDGTVELVRIGGPANPRLPAIPHGSGRGGVLGLWFDPSGGLHASTTPSMQAGYSEVDDYDYNGVSWDAAGNDVLTRVFPSGSSPIDLAYHAQKWAFTPHYVITHPHEIDLGETTGAGIAVRPKQEARPTPTPTPTSNALPAAPSPPPWTATLVPVQLTGHPSGVIVRVLANGVSTDVETLENTSVAIAGWTGPDRRTLVWSHTQDYPGDQGIRTVAFSADGRMVGKPADLEAPSTSARLVGRPFVLPDASLVVWRFGSDTSRRPRGTLLRFSSDLTSATTQTLPAGDAVFATADVVALQAAPGLGAQAQSATGPITLVDRTGAVSQTTDVGSCADGWQASLDPTSAFAALSCGRATVTGVTLSGAKDPVPTTVLAPLPDGAKVAATWFDATGGLHASSRGSDGTFSDYRWDTEQGVGIWTSSAVQGVITAAWVDGYAVQLVSDGSPGLAQGTWSTATSPSLELGPGEQANANMPQIGLRPTS